MDAFVYIWNDNITGKMYIGSHKGTKDDGYICSSKYMKEEYNIRPQHFSRVIVAECETYKQARHLEVMLLKRIDAAHNPLYYNKSNGDGYHDGSMLTEESRQKISQTLKRKHASGEIVNPMTGGTHTPEIREKIRMLKIGTKHTEEWKRNHSNKLKLLHASGRKFAHKDIKNAS